MRLLPLAVNGGRYDELKTARSASPDELMRGGSVEAEGLVADIRESDLLGKTCEYEQAIAA